MYVSGRRGGGLPEKQKPKGSAMYITATRCDRCDQDQPGVRTYVCQFSGHPVAEQTRYCPTCADMASVNWNGATESITGHQTLADAERAERHRAPSIERAAVSLFTAVAQRMRDHGGQGASEDLPHRIAEILDEAAQKIERL